MVCPFELGGEEPKRGRDHDEGRSRQHDHGEPGGEQQAAEDQHAEPAQSMAEASGGGGGSWLRFLWLRHVLGESKLRASSWDLRNALSGACPTHRSRFGFLSAAAHGSGANRMQTDMAGLHLFRIIEPSAGSQGDSIGLSSTRLVFPTPSFGRPP